MSKKKKKFIKLIRVIVRGGCVELVDRIPIGYGVEVIDYDTQNDRLDQQIWFRSMTYKRKSK